jgi:hypothetical protein
MTAPSSKRIPALMLVLLAIVAAFAIYDSTRMRIDRRDSTLHSSTASARPTLARPAPATGRSATGPAPRTSAQASAARQTPSPERHGDSGDLARTVLTIGLLVVAGIVALTLGAIFVLAKFTQRRGTGPPLA